MTTGAAVDVDPQVAAVYAAEDDALAASGPALRRWVDVEGFVERVVASVDWSECPVAPPIEIHLERRSRSATFAAASATEATIWIPDGRWTAHTVVHELAHLLQPAPDPHGSAFCGAELWVVRRVLGFDAYGALRSANDRAGVSYDDACPSPAGHTRVASSSS
jgi:putative metallohydrolase (TIGR04338 family)